MFEIDQFQIDEAILEKGVNSENRNGYIFLHCDLTINFHDLLFLSLAGKSIQLSIHANAMI